MLLGLTISGLVAEIETMADSIIAGTFLNQETVAAICLVYPAINLSWFFNLLFSYGAEIIYSKQVGGYDKENADKTFGNGVIINAAIGIFLFLFFTVFGTGYLKLYGAEGEILLLAQKYLSWMSFVMLITPLLYFIGIMTLADGDEKSLSISKIFTSISKIAGSVILCTGLGIDGLGLASVVSVYAGFFILLLHFFKKSNSLRFRFYFSLSHLSQMAKFSVIDSGKYLFLAIYTAVINKFVLSCFGEGNLILVSIITLTLETSLVFESVGDAASPFLSVYLSEDNFAGLRKVWKLALRSAILEGSVATVLFILLSPLIPRLFGITQGPIKLQATWGALIMGLGFVCSSVTFLLTSYLLIIEKIRLGFLATMLSIMVIPVTLGCSLGYLFGIFGLFAGIAAALFATIAIIYIYLCLTYGKENVPLLLADLEKGKTSFYFEFMANPQNIVDTRDEIGTALKRCNVPELTASRVMRLFEEVSMVIYEKNTPEKVSGECSVIVYPKRVRIITRFDGKEIDLSDSDMNANSFREYSLSMLIAMRGFEGRALPAMSFNRNEYQVEY